MAANQAAARRAPHVATTPRNSRWIGRQFGPPAARVAAYSGTVSISLQPFDFARAAARAGLRPDGQPLRAPAAPTEPAGFQAVLAQALRGVSDSQLEAQAMQREVQFDNPTVSIEQTMVAMNKSQVGFQAAVSVRNRLVQAYTEIMNMQV